MVKKVRNNTNTLKRNEDELKFDKLVKCQNIVLFWDAAW